MAENGRYIRREISVGNILTIGAILFTAFSAWGYYKSTMEYHERRIAKIESVLEERQKARLEEVRLITEIRTELVYLRMAVQKRERADIGNKGG